MKSKTKTILIFAAILAAVFLIAFLDGGAVQSAADEEEEGTLIGAFVSEEDIDIGGDLAVSAAGKFVWKAGRLYMEADDWSALGERGGGLPGHDACCVRRRVCDRIFRSDRGARALCAP